MKGKGIRLGKNETVDILRNSIHGWLHLCGGDGWQHQ